MASSPAFISTPRIGTCSLSSANSATDGTGTITDLITGVSAGTRVLEIAVQSTATTVASLVNIFLYDGVAWSLFDQVTVTATTGSTTAKGVRSSVSYTNLILPSTSYKLGCTITVQPSSGSVKVFAFGGDLT